ncbi:ribosomal L7/L12-like protein [Flavobacterium sp. 9]|uniref:ribosomal protein L7/L12 n=1 Tax=Flavobacterium sp. 9 TaxID=2035198 RepID=UPI000C1798B8|nr:ribosomal protein L7/L12 [Flavobacterium sp. 9]PIF30642.1 ribosomal L7/L12-like protein [Flavobacterium sp. 9]
MEFQKYFQSYEDYFWEWDNQIFSEDSVFESLAIPNGQTIGYEKFVFEILEYLSEDSIPPFGSLLLAIIATNPENCASVQMIYELAKSKDKSDSFRTIKSTEASDFFRIGASIGFIKILASLPEEYKVGQKRMKLFQTIFHQCHNRISDEKAKKILKEYKEHRHHLARAGVKDAFNEANFIKDFRTLALLKVKFPTVQSLLKAMEDIPHEDLGDKLKEEVLEEKNLSDNVTSFVDQLIEEDKTFHVGSLIKRLWSGLNIPLHHNHPSEQPLGGISDLTNKGDFDKLVISEFAYDDDVFMSRIANNEALYIQREVPPEADKFVRILLIDSSLKNWGNPKILSFASAIAIARHPKTDIECKAFIVGKNYEEVSFDNVNNVIDALSNLSGKLDCSDGLNSFFLENKISSKNQEVFLFSSEESLKLAPMQKVTNDYFVDIKYTFSVGMQDVTVFKNHNKGKKMLQHIIMPLDELWVRNSKETITVAKNSTSVEIPLLYPVERFYKNVFESGGNFYFYLNGSLYQFFDNSFDKGLKKIASNLPFGNGEYAIKENDKGEKTMLYYFFDSAQNVSTINLETREIKKFKLIDDELNEGKLAVFEYNQDFFFMNNIYFWRINDDFSLDKAFSKSIKEAFDTHFEKQTVFVRNYRYNKFKYGVVKRLESVVIQKDVFKINNFYLSNFFFEKESKFSSRMSEDSAIKLEEKVNLVLKNVGTSPLAVIQTIKTNTDISLRDCKTITEQPFGVILESVKREVAEKLKKEIEKNGAVCYIENVLFEAVDGSTIRNQDGILIFESSNKQIEKIYIPFVIGTTTVMATENDFAGNSYFIEDAKRENIGEDRFSTKYLKRFIQNIIHHGA